MNREMELFFDDLRDVIGKDAFDKLLKYVGGGSIWFPTYDIYYRRERNLQIVALWKQGFSLSDIARKFGITRQMVFYICKNSLEAEL